MSKTNDTPRDLELLTQLSEIALELGWVIAVPPSEVTDGIIMGNVKFVASFDELLPEGEKLDVLIHESQMEDLEEELNQKEEAADTKEEKEILATNIVPLIKGKKGGGYVH